MNLQTPTPSCPAASRRFAKRRGAMILLIAILLPVLLALSTLAVNLAYVQVINTKTQIVTDVSARAAGAAYVVNGNEAAGVAAAQEMAALNPIESVVLNLDAGDLEFGLSQRKAQNMAYSLTTAANGNAVRITTHSFHNGAGPALRPFFEIMGANYDIRPLCRATHAQTTLDVAVIVDRSGSMAFAADESSAGGGTPASAPAGWQFGDPAPPQSRWLDLVEAVHGFCDEMGQTAKVEQVALCSYASSSTKLVDLTAMYQQIFEQLDNISASFPNGSTNIGDGILAGLAAVTEPRFARPWATNALVLMSDGNHNTGTDPISAAEQAAQKSVPIYTVSFSQEADRALMQKVADLTGGRHYHASDAAQLNAAFRNIARRLPAMLTE